MLCTLCRGKLNTKDDSFVLRSRDLVVKGREIVWAKMPIHDACLGKVDFEIGKNRILMAAGHPYYEFKAFDRFAKRGAK